LLSRAQRKRGEGGKGRLFHSRLEARRLGEDQSQDFSQKSEKKLELELKLTGGAPSRERRMRTTFFWRDETEGKKMEYQLK